jgi:hypothetical protein
VASLKYPDSGSRLVQYANGDFAAGAVAILYADRTGTTLAEIYTDSNGTPGALITNSTVTLDAYGQQPTYWGPVAGTTTLYITVDGGPLVPVDAAYGPRLDATSVDSSVVHLTGNETITGTKAFTTPPTVPTPTAPGHATPRSYTDLRRYGDGTVVATDPQWGYTTGTDLYTPLTAIIAALGVAGGRVIIPSGNWTLSAPINIKNGVHIEGSGKQATKVTATGGGFYWSTSVHEFFIEHLRLDVTGGHIFWSTNGTPFYKSQMKHLMLNQNDINYSIAYHHGIGDWDKVIFEDCDMVRAPGSLYPAFDIVNSGNAANDNVWRDCGVDGQNCTSSPFFWVENTSTANYAWDNVFENITGERNPGGIIRALSHRNLRIVNVVDWDTTVNYVASHVHVGKSTASGSTSSKNVFIAGCGRRIGGGSAFSGTYDVNLPAGEVQYVDVFSPHNNGVSGSVNFSTADFVNVWGAGSLAWTGQPAGVGNHIGSGVDINGPLLVNGTQRSAGTVAPNGAVTGNIGDEYTNKSGGVGTSKWFKESGNATTTGWVAFDTGISVPRSVLTGARLLLNGHPYPATVGTASWAKDTWRWAPISLYSQMPINFFSVVATTNASVGTATMIFALYGLDAYNRPGAMAVDYSSYGSIDLTAGSAGAEKLLATTGLIIPAGDWYLGCAWTGTATGNPTMDAITGNHPEVASNAPGSNNNAYSQAVTGTTPPLPAVPSGAAASGIAVWAILG